MPLPHSNEDDTYAYSGPPEHQQTALAARQRIIDACRCASPRSQASPTDKVAAAPFQQPTPT